MRRLDISPEFRRCARCEPDRHSERGGAAVVVLAETRYGNGSGDPQSRRVPSEGGVHAASPIGKTTVDLLKPCGRLLDLLDTPQDIPFLSSLIQREVVYRLLQGSQGERLRAIATLGDQTNKTAKAIAWLRANYTKPLRLEELAEVARMGISTLHHHFRALTAMSPLQYQKQLRLVAARERMLVEGLDAASAAFEVGYESPSQFNREYKRFFGQPPMRDIKGRRLAGAAAVSD